MHMFKNLLVHKTLTMQKPKLATFGKSYLDIAFIIVYAYLENFQILY